jgi:hypothetical protein
VAIGLLLLMASGAFAASASAAFIQPGERLTGSGDWFGHEKGLAISSDGNTALIAAPWDKLEKGAVWVFTRSGSTWTQQGGKITESGGTSSFRLFGISVALSADGNTALIGGGREYGQGAAWVFTRSGSTWSQQGGTLMTDGFVSGVALSADGNTALIGAGGVSVFTRSGSTWTRQGFLGGFGFHSSLALSADGNTALIGSPGDGNPAIPIGEGRIFTRSGSTWSQQGLAPSDATACQGFGCNFGFSVALSADGDTALVGGTGDSHSAGAAWVFTRSGSRWKQRGSKLTGGGEINRSLSCCFGGEFGRSVALSSDGSTALIGGPYDNLDVGAAWVFTRSGSTWTQLGEKLTGGGGIGHFGETVGLSGDGDTALIGEPVENAAWVFENVNPPTVEKVSPHGGPTGGGTTVTITGTNFTGAKAVRFGSSNATSFTVDSATSITAVSPAEAAGIVDVTVTTPGGTSDISSHDRFDFRADGH